MPFDVLVNQMVERLLRLADTPIRCRTPFFVAFMGRSGSTHLYHLLNQHHNIYCAKEVFNPAVFRGPRGGQTIPQRIEYLVRRWGKRALGRERVLGLKLRQIYGNSAPSVRGFQLKIERGKDVDSFPEIWHWLNHNRPRMKCIFLYRKNNLRAAISSQNLKRIKKSGFDANIPSGIQHDLSKLVVDLDWAIRETREREEINARFSAELRKEFETLSICYEELIASECSNLSNCFHFLNAGEILPGAELIHMTQKISGTSLPDYVENFDALERRVVVEGLQHYLDVA